VTEFLIREAEVPDEVADKILGVAFTVYRALPNEKRGERRDVASARLWARETIKAFGFKVPVPGEPDG